ncbi:MAG: LamG domain-containing protein, partial [Sedimentisphaerales bacterium]|nr:LamG domain-containing protein [Sedimentisphaerales bacterium]
MYGHEAQLVNSPEWVDGKYGSALEFDGTNYVIVPITDTLQLVETFTVEFWVQRGATQPGTWNYMVAGGTLMWGVIFNASDESVYVWSRSGGTWAQRLVSSVPLSTDWTHIAMTYDVGSGVELYFDGEKAGEGGAPPVVDEIDGSIMVGARNPGQEFFAGLIDEVALYDRILSLDEITKDMKGEPRPSALAPNPSDGAMLESTSALLTWRPGDFAVSHDIYFGESFDDVNQATREDDTLRSTQAEAALAVEGLTPGATYYWRVDEVNDLHPDTPWKGNVWSFWVRPEIAWRPVPANGGTYVDPDQDLSWEKGLGALFHTVYFGETFEEVRDMPAGGWMTAAAVYDPGTLEPDKTYYWRVDEFAQTGTHKGEVWSFTTVPEIPVADDPNLVLWWTMDEGQGAVGPADWSGHSNRATMVDDVQWSVDGYDGGALEFDGRKDYIYAPMAPILPSQTVCLWVKTREAPASILGWSNAHPTHGTHDKELYVNADGRVEWRIWTAADNIVTSVKTIRDGHWHHLAGVYTDEGTTELYLDGVSQGSNSASGIYNAYASPYLTVGIESMQSRYLVGAVDDVRVYDKALSLAEIEEVMRGDPLLAANPDPARGATVDIRDATALSWSAGGTAVSHDVYFGTDRDAVASAGRNVPEFRGNQPGAGFSLAGLVAFGGGDYYWRIDEVETDGTVRTGKIWRFTIPAHLIVDDFESYTNEVGSRVFEVWVDGVGFTLPEPGNLGNGTGAVVGHDIWSVDSPY